MALYFTAEILGIGQYILFHVNIQQITFNFKLFGTAIYTRAVLGAVHQLSETRSSLCRGTTDPLKVHYIDTYLNVPPQYQFKCSTLPPPPPPEIGKYKLLCLFDDSTYHYY